MNPQIGQPLNDFGAFQMMGSDGVYNKNLATGIALKGIAISQNPDPNLAQTFDARANNLDLRNGMLKQNVAETMLPPAPGYTAPAPAPRPT
jgi:hypothetical protein